MEHGHERVTDRQPASASRAARAEGAPGVMMVNMNTCRVRAASLPAPVRHGAVHLLPRRTWGGPGVVPLAALSPAKTVVEGKHDESRRCGRPAERSGQELALLQAALDLLERSGQDYSME